MTEKTKLQIKEFEWPARRLAGAIENKANSAQLSWGWDGACQVLGRTVHNFSNLFKFNFIWLTQLDNLDWINITCSFIFGVLRLVFCNNLPDSIPEREENIDGYQGSIANIEKPLLQRVRTYN